jgi:hypothetical protein
MSVWCFAELLELRLGSDCFYKLLKGNRLPFPLKLLQYALASILVFPATAFAGFESLLGMGGVIRVTARKTSGI